jgi:hypothetical protein
MPTCYNSHRVSLSSYKHMTSVQDSCETGGEKEYSRREVVYALLLFAHFGSGGEELLGEKRSVKVGGRCGVDGSCL